MNQPNAIKMVTLVPKKLSEVDQRAADNLKRIWSKHKDKHGVTQLMAAKTMGWTQGNFCQYVNGKVRLGDSALRQFCEYFACNLSDIRPEYSDPTTEQRLVDLERALDKAVSKLQTIKDSADKNTKGEIEDLIASIEKSIHMLNAKNA